MDNLSREEQEILELFAAGKLKSVENAEQKMAAVGHAAASHRKKDQRINIRLSSFDLNRIKRISANEGLPYQTLIASVLHRYASSRIANNEDEMSE